MPIALIAPQTLAAPAIMGLQATAPPAQPWLERALGAKPRRLIIQGLTKDGRAFRPSDWAERLAGALSSFRPDAASAGIGAHIGYSPYCVPRVIGGLKCVIVDSALRGVELLAWDFVMNFARDNELEVIEAAQ
jgi:Protein of unknown function (DUF3579)